MYDLRYTLYDMRYTLWVINDSDADPMGGPLNSTFHSQLFETRLKIGLLTRHVDISSVLLLPPSLPLPLLLLLPLSAHRTSHAHFGSLTSSASSFALSVVVSSCLVSFVSFGG